jgi:hypothetical protein
VKKEAGSEIFQPKRCVNMFFAFENGFGLLPLLLLITQGFIFFTLFCVICHAIKSDGNLLEKCLLSFTIF